jgi:hypothetical protein
MSAITWDLPKQTCRTENGEVGDCWRCCIAAILQVPAEAVPHFVRDTRAPEPETQRWLNARGYVLVQVAGGDDWPTGFQFPRFGEDGDACCLPVISCGVTVRSQKPSQHHAVVTRGGLLVYDPHPSNAGLLCVTEQFLVVPTHAAAVAMRSAELPGLS